VTPSLAHEVQREKPARPATVRVT